MMLLPLSEPSNNDKFEVKDGKLQLNQTAKPPWKQQHRLKLLQNLHGLKDAGATWFNQLRKGLTEDLKFKQSLVDPCLFYYAKDWS